MRYQRFVSLTAMLSFVLLIISSGVLYFIADRKVTAWTSWGFLGLDKQQWDNIHINIGILSLIMIVWHIYFNWKPIKNYLKEKKKLKIFTKEFNIALIVVSVFTAGTITMTLPFSFLVNIGNGIKAINSLNNGNPPFGYAEYATLGDFCLITSIDIHDALDKLKRKNIKVSSSGQILKDIAKNNDISPKDIFSIIKTDTTKFDLPSDIPIGIAHKSLTKLAQEYNMSLDKFITHLSSRDIKISADTSFKKIAKQNDLHPAQLYNILLASQKLKQKDKK